MTIERYRNFQIKNFYPHLKVYSLPLEIKGYDIYLYWDNNKDDEPETERCKEQLFDTIIRINEKFEII